MTKREAAIVTAHTGMLVGKFEDFHAYVAEIMERPVYMHEMGIRDIAGKIKSLAQEDFIELEVTG
ncbi:hypothetical protein UFOVP1138_77 [uncultured Caudovirales phage]|uniref:DUF7736 domain-containing protein n=1 Tax=uncultured Caudovirales phage TaxID=2100421 RepID=A0A6J5S7C3_9CAUD|nr:hypothetical protein UFOVP975_43 [uncultured Caudovirales phage]CAB4186323.1 hypothetical protein UFOVP1138_77 [uncultured Caudovirales phage]CAB4204458.1 hypothetical protein UFOVP1394_74 [uncultured Caudovirales phage]